VAWALLAVFVVLPGDEGGLQAMCYAGFLGALAAAAADTWATELGVWTSERPWSLRTAARVTAGQSGAVSLGGTAAALLGAGSVVAAGALAGGPIGPVTGEQAAVGIGAGLAGMAVDSLAGAFLQARYREPWTGRLVETAVGGTGTHVDGWSFVDNEAVNLLGTATGAAVAILLW
jgi:uncharacterized membrane protein